MKKRRMLTGSLVIALLMITACNTGNYPGELDKLVPEASLIFKAKVVLLHTVTTDEDDVSNSGVVEVTEVIEAPEALQNISGQQVTVRFADIQKVNVGEERLFFAEPYLVGESIGVREVGSVMKDSKLYLSKELPDYIRQARAKQSDEQLKLVLNDSKLVITGKVLKISKTESRMIIGTEHDPAWREAEIQIEETLKGKTADKTVKILFASSNDVMYFNSPKFREGDDGIFIIQQADPATVKLLRNENMVVKPSGFIKGMEGTARIKSLLK